MLQTGSEPSRDAHVVDGLAHRHLSFDGTWGINHYLLFPANISALDVFKISEKYRGSYRRHPRPPSRRTNRYHVLRPRHKHTIYPYCALNEGYPAPHTNKHTTHTQTQNAHGTQTHTTHTQAQRTRMAEGNQVVHSASQQHLKRKTLKRKLQTIRWTSNRPKFKIGRVSSLWLSLTSVAIGNAT